MAPIDPATALNTLLAEIRRCTTCAAALPLGPRPIVSAAGGARIVIIGQAPGTRVHESGVPWDDDSGQRLRSWLGVSDAAFYDPEQFALMPMGFCYPGRKGAGDAPPRPECAPLWHARLLAALPNLRLTLLVGQYAQRAYLGRARKTTLTETVRSFAEYLPDRFPTPHPTWRSRVFMRKHPWFEGEALPALRRSVNAALAS